MARGDGRVYQRGNHLWICYYFDGEQIREAAKDRQGKNTNDPEIAAAFLKATLKKVHAAEVNGLPFATPKTRKTTIHDLLDNLKQKFELNGQASPQNLSHIRGADKYFGHLRAVGVEDEVFTEHQTERLEEGDKPATVNRRLQMVRQAYALAVKKFPFPPSIPMLSEKDNVRKGFFTEREFRAVLAHLPSDLRDFVAFAGACGMRKSELASLTWGMVEGDELNIPGDITKNREPRTLPITGELAEIIERRRSSQRVEVNGVARLVEHVFHRDGEPIREFRKSWARACVRAKVGVMVCPKCKDEGDALECEACGLATFYHGRIFHDLRRFAVRNSVKSGVPTQLAKLWSGHSTDEIFERYSILDTTDLREAFAKTEQYRKQVEQQKIVAVR